MAQTNIELARRAVAAFNDSDADAFAALTTSDFEWLPSMSPVDGETFVGADGVAAYFAALRNAWEYFHVLADEYREGRDLVLALGRLEGRGKGSGATVDSPLGMAFELRAGQIARITGYLDYDVALAAVGLER